VETQLIDQHAVRVNVNLVKDVGNLLANKQQEFENAWKEVQDMIGLTRSTAAQQWAVEFPQPNPSYDPSDDAEQTAFVDLLRTPHAAGAWMNRIEALYTSAGVDFSNVLKNGNRAGQIFNALAHPFLLFIPKGSSVLSLPAEWMFGVQETIITECPVPI
jgi:hypothetical protein